MSRVALALGVTAVVLCASGWAAAQEPRPRVLVMPFDNVTGEGRILWLSEASAVLLADELNALGVDAISRQERIAAFERVQVPSAATLTEATVFRIGQIVGASHVVVGRLRLHGDVLEVSARSIALEEGRLYREAHEQGPLPELYATFARIARQLAPAPEVLIDVENERLPVAAFENYVKGLLAETPATAISYLNAALLANPAFPRARLALWDIYTGTGDFERALAAVQQVPGNAPRARRARFLAGLSQLALGRYDDAFTTYTLLAEASPTANVLNNLGVVQLRRGGALGAGLPASFFIRAAAADSGEPDYYFNAGYASWFEGDLPSAAHWLREAVRRNPTDGEAHFVLAATLNAAGETEQAKREYELARRLSSTFEQLPGSAVPASIPMGLERLKTDVELPHTPNFESAVAPGDQRGQDELERFYLERGRRLVQQENDREAIAELNRVLFLSPYHAEAQLLLGRVHLRAGRITDAVNALRISLWSAETAEAHAALGAALFEAGDARGARSEAADALALDPDSAEARRVMEDTEELRSDRR